jgi:hypothetical protein
MSGSNARVSRTVQEPLAAYMPQSPRTKIANAQTPERVGKKSKIEDQLVIVYRALASLKPYERNARTHSREQIAKIKQSLLRNGWTNPILTGGDLILAGHARHQAASELAVECKAIRRNVDPLSAPTIDLSHLSVDEQRAYILADNKLAEEAGWNPAMLRLEFVDLSLKGIDLSLTGFSPEQYAPFLAPAESDDERVLTESEDASLDRAWSLAISEWRTILTSNAIAPFVTSSYTKGVLAVLYLRSLYYGDDIPRGATLAYTPNRCATVGDHGAIVDALDAALQPDGRSVRNSIRWASAQKPSLDKLAGAMTLPIHGMRLPGDFPALLARDLIAEFCPAGGSVLDPCHGWGGRLLGFLLSDAERYVGYDPSPLTNQGVSAMASDLIALTPERVKHARLIGAPFEDALLKARSFDFALTSPPYFDTEKYDGASSSWRLYQSYDAWVAGFYKPLIVSAARALKRGGVFALQVGSQRYPLQADAVRLARDCGMLCIETRHTQMINNRTGTDPDDGEVVVILRKQ